MKTGFLTSRPMYRDLFTDFVFPKSDKCLKAVSEYYICEMNTFSGSCIITYVPQHEKT